MVVASQEVLRLQNVERCFEQVVQPSRRRTDQSRLGRLAMRSLAAVVRLIV